MDIAIFHTTLPQPERKPGGVEVAVHRLANALVEIGHTVTVYSATEAPLAARYDHERVLSRIPFSPDNRGFRLLALPFLLNITPLGDHEILHLHGDDWFYVSRTAPTVRTFHGSAIEEAQAADSWPRYLEQLFVYPLEHLANRLATRSVAIGPKTSRIYDTARLVNNGVNLDRFHPGPKTSSPSVLFVGTWAGRKRGRFLFETFVNKVLPALPAATLYMVADRCPSHPRVEHLERPSTAELAALYRKAWVFASPSVYEGFGIPYLEAMASGTAIVCSPNDGAQYVLGDGTYGIISSDEAFGHNLVRLLQDASHRQDLVEQGLSRAETFSWQNVAERHETLYRNTIQQAA